MKKHLLFLWLLCSGFANLTAQVVILDFEAANTSTTFQYFGSTLDGTLNNIIANPDASGINTSAMVAEFLKPADAQTWAGAYSNPALSIPIDLTSNTEVCIKVWFNAPGNLAMKLEGGDQPNWVRTLDVTETQTWVELCFDVSEASIEDPFQPAFGGTYTILTLFFDFGDAPTADRTYYFDDVIVKGGNLEPVDITFAVDMNAYTGTYTTAYVSGTFNNWSADANPLSDGDGDGIWTGTVTGITSGAHEYKFQLDQWANEEMFNGFEACTVADPSGQFVNRKLIATSDAVLPPVCYNSCYACGQGVQITINLGEAGITVSDDGLFIAGGGNFGNPGDFPLSDPDGDGVHSITLERAVGFESFFTFTNGACGDFSCKENIAGQDCADPDNFNDRHMGPIMMDTTINTCFALCTTTTNCTATQGNITFQVDMSDYADPFTTVYVAGSFNGWSGDGNPLSDDDGDGVWSGTFPLAFGNYEFKFELDNWAVQEEFTDGDPCTITDPSGQFVNRLIEVTEDASICFFWNTCDECMVNGLDELAAGHFIFTMQPTIVQNETTLIFGEQFTAEKEMHLFNGLGQSLQQAHLPAGADPYLLDLSRLENGLYFVSILTEGKQQLQRVIIHR